MFPLNEQNLKKNIMKKMGEKFNNNTKNCIEKNNTFFKEKWVEKQSDSD